MVEICPVHRVEGCVHEAGVVGLAPVDGGGF